MTYELLVFLFLFKFQVIINTGPDSQALRGKMVLTKKEIGAIGTVDGERITISLFQGKRNTIWKPLLRPNGRQFI